jgi:hypothetical protein
MGVQKAEFRKIENLPPVLLYKKDLIILEKLLKSDINSKDDDYRIDIGHENKSTPISTITELTDELPESSNEVSIRIIGWNSEREIENGISIRLYHNYANYQIHAFNEVWFDGKRSQLNAFFRSRRPWYSWLNASIPFLTPLLSWAAIAIAIWGYRDGLIWATIIATLLFISVIVVGLLNYKQQLFPYVKVFFTDKPNRKLALEAIILVLELAILIATLLSIIIPLMAWSK